MSTIGPPGRIPGTYPTRSGQERRETDEAHDPRRRDDDDFSGAGGGHEFGEPGQDHHPGGHPGGGMTGDFAAPHGHAGGPADADSAGQAELERRTDGFRRSLEAAMARAGGEAASGAPGDLVPGAGREAGGQSLGGGMSGFAQLFARSGEDGGAGARRGAREEEEIGQVLAASGPAAGSTLPLFPALQPVQEPAAGLRGHDIVAAVEERVAQAIRAENAAQSGAASAITINVAGLAEGLDAITIRMSTTGVDVVLTGALDLSGEAQSLADRLSRRFGNRSIRILTAPAGDGRRTEPGNGEKGRGGSPVASQADETA